MKSERYTRKYPHYDIIPYEHERDEIGGLMTALRHGDMSFYSFDTVGVGKKI